MSVSPYFRALKRLNGEKFMCKKLQGNRLCFLGSKQRNPNDIWFKHPIHNVAEPTKGLEYRKP
jgi:hypothetical protein